MPKIMIVDDDATIRMELAERLTHMGYTVAGTADTGESAIEMAEDIKPDLILMDIKMPGEVDGISAAEKIRENTDTAVVFITGFGDPEYIERAKQAEPFGYVMKPFDEQEIRGIIEIVLHKKKLELELTTVHGKLKESEERFRTIYEQSPIGIQIYSPEGKLRYVNKACLDIFGISGVSEVMGSRLFEDPNIPDKNRKRLREGGNVRYEMAFDFEKIKLQKLYETTKSGTHYLDVQITPLGLSAGESLAGYLVQVMDITARKRAEEEREQMLSQLQATLDATVDGIIVVSLNSKIRAFSRRFKKIWHMPDAILHSKDADQALEYVFDQLSNPELFSQKVQIASADPHSSTLDTLNLKDGRIFEVYSRPQVLDGKVTGRVWAFRDITEPERAKMEQKQLEAQLLQIRKMEAIGTLTGGIAHDYNNLLAVIMGNLSLAMEDVEPKSGLAVCLNEADIASRKARDLTHELMALSSGGTPVKEVGALGELLENTVKSIPAGSGVSIKKSVAQDLWPVRYDPRKMGAVFRNVVTNAVEAMNDGDTLSIRAENLRIKSGRSGPSLPPKTGDYIQISIRDQGVGIPEKYLNKIFDPYFSTKAMGVRKGMGLGLTTAYTIVQKHGGHMAVDSTPDMGTTVNIYLPAEPEADEAQRAESADSAAPSKTRRVLVMDDEEMLRKLAKLMLKKLGFEAETVKDGIEAIDAYKKRQQSSELFDAVILDLTVKGGMGGEQTIRELLKIDPHIKAIVSSGYSHDPIIADFGKYGFMGALTKPYRMEDMKKALGGL